MTILMTDSVRLPDPVPAAMGLAPGSAVIVRHYDDSDRKGLAKKLIALCRPRHISVFIAADPRLALAVNADGLHLPDALLARHPKVWRRLLPPAMMLSAAAHCPHGLKRAAAVAADFALLSPLFASKSHLGGRPIGVLRFAAWASKSPLPVYALGGVHHQNARRLAGSGARGWAAISAFK